MLFNFDFSRGLKGVALGATIVVVLGLLDDAFDLPAIVKLGGQVAGATVAIAYGVVLSVVPYWIPGASWLNVVLTLLWFLTVTNALQFLDGMDGLAAGLGVIAGLFFSIAALQMHQSYIFILAAPLVGACLGFLPYNLRPGGALIFLGDSGASFIGFTLAGLAVMGEWAENDPIVALLTPVAHPGRSAVRYCLRGGGPGRDGQGALGAGVAGLRRQGSHPPSLRGGGAQQDAERLPDLLHRRHAGPLGHPAQGGHAPRGCPGAAASRLRAGDHRGPRGGRPRTSPAMISPRRMCSPQQWRQWLAMLVSLDESPRRMALALAVGVFLSFTPFWGFQTLLAVVVATVARLNPALTLAGTWLNLPWFAPFVYAGAVKIGSALLPDLSGLAGWSVWLLVGSTMLGLVAAGVTWLVAFGVIRARRTRRTPERSRRIAPRRLSQDRFAGGARYQGGAVAACCGAAG